MSWLLFLALLGQINSADSPEMHMHAGVVAYRNGNLKVAISEFQKAAGLDPKLIRAHQFLAMAYANQYVPGVDTSENVAWAKHAIDEFQNVLAMDPDQPMKVAALKGIGNLYFQQKKFEDAKQYQRKIIELLPQDAEAHFTIGVIDWTQAYQQRMQTRSDLKLGAAEEMWKLATCWSVKSAIANWVDDGISKLNKAIEYRKDYDDAMAYMNLLLREKADIECGDPVAHDEDVRQANHWVQLTMETKKARSDGKSHPQ
jgi:tetratricopeptide (TPR) repeat protein